MQKPKRNIDYHEHPQEQFPDLSSVASANECTGLMYKMPRDGEEFENYQQLSPMAIPKVDPPQNGNRKPEKRK